MVVFGVKLMGRDCFGDHTGEFFREDRFSEAESSRIGSLYGDDIHQKQEGFTSIHGQPKGAGIAS
jgi:hypothetical protein